MDNILHLLVGTYTTSGSKGIGIYRFNQQTGESRSVGVAEVENPSYLDSCKNSKYIYSVSENEDKPSFVNAFSFDHSTEQLTLLNSQPTVGEGPCNIRVDCDRDHVLTANYGDGSISVFEVNNYGPLHKVSQVIKFAGHSIDPERQKESHVHCVEFSPENKYVFATDLGTDMIYRFEIDHVGKGDYLKEETKKIFKVPAGSGPRHFVFHSCGKFMYLINELSGTVIVYAYNKGNLKETQIIKFDDFDAGGGGDIRICPNGQFLYASNRLKGDGVAVFYIDPADGKLTRVGYQFTGIHPRNLSITPNGKFLLVACRDSKCVEIYKIDQNTGLLTNIKKDIKTDKPVCLHFV